MDHMQQQQQRQRQAGGGERGGGGESVYRPSGARWTPTAEQTRLLRELYHGCGIRSPSSEQIQRIAAMLRQYGRIEGKNVFYWFQNHKARERQKKRLTTLDVNTAAAAADANHLAVLSLSPTGAAAPSPPAGFCSGNGGVAAVQMDQASVNWDSSTAMVLQDYMGVSSVGAAAAPAPWATTTREPQTLPLFPVGGGGWHGGPGESGQEGGVGHGSFPPNFQRWGSAAAVATTTITTATITVQQQHNFYRNQQPIQLQDAAGTSLELTLSSYCSPYPAGSM